MNVYKVLPCAPMTGGCAIVVAENEQQACELVRDCGDGKIESGYISLSATLISELSSNNETPHIIVYEIVDYDDEFLR